MRHATSGTSMEWLWVSMWAWVASRGPPNRRSQIAGPGGVCVCAIGPGHQASDRQPAMWLSMSICAPPRYDCTRELRSQGPPPPPPGPAVGGLALVVTAAGPHLPPPHMSPPTSLLQPTAPQSPPTKAPGIFQSHLKGPCLCSNLCRRGPLTRGCRGGGKGRRGGGRAAPSPSAVLTHSGTRTPRTDPRSGPRGDHNGAV